MSEMNFFFSSSSFIANVAARNNEEGQKKHISGKIGAFEGSLLWSC